MVVNLKAKKRLAARVTGVGVHRIKFDADHLDDIADAITRENIRSLIWLIQSKLNHLREHQEEGRKKRKIKGTKGVQHRVPSREERAQGSAKRRFTLPRFAR